MIHRSVLLNEVVKWLDPQPGQKFIDATFGGGGHAAEILKRIKPGGGLLGIEIDEELFGEARERFSQIKEIILVNDSYANLEEIARVNDFDGADGILFDFGLSSWHLERSGRGFSFLKDEPLDMRFNSREKDAPRAMDIVNTWDEKEIARILEEYGEEKFAGQIARAIVAARKIKPITSTFQLIEVIKEAVPLRYRRGRIHFATKTFQALRIAVNNELENMEKGLRQIPGVLKSGGRGAAISFHSLEDRIVKKVFKEFKERGIATVLTPKPIRPSQEEIFSNPRSRSAKLRIIYNGSNQSGKNK